MSLSVVGSLAATSGHRPGLAADQVAGADTIAASRDGEVNKGHKVAVEVSPAIFYSVTVRKP